MDRTCSIARRRGHWRQRPHLRATGMHATSRTTPASVKFTKDGKFIKTWGRMGSEPGNFREPHDLYVGGSKGYVYVADRQNNRVQCSVRTATSSPRGSSSVSQARCMSTAMTTSTSVPRTRASLQARPLSGRQPSQRRGHRDRQRDHRRAEVRDSRSGDLSKMTDTGTSASVSPWMIRATSMRRTWASNISGSRPRTLGSGGIAMEVTCASCWWSSGSGCGASAAIRVACRSAGAGASSVGTQPEILSVSRPVNALAGDQTAPPAPTGPAPRPAGRTIDLDGAGSPWRRSDSIAGD